MCFAQPGQIACGDTQQSTLVFEPESEANHVFFDEMSNSGSRAT
jgi:hypothetical protein